ncbi:protein TAB2 homolog, chloroplastic [Humulus lupulus]|uniref:protein TAB2 homolog, chloroplastic n=1 Tax=Humulus lupulus TaxID=3486 RepID=UPI002B41002E|nr:protein TAB2 homolog, chloroplastic [Humulus lupulus]
MASLSFNSSRLRTPAFQSQKPISNFKKPIKIPFSFSSSPPRSWPKLRRFGGSSSVSGSSVSMQEEVEIEEEEEEEDDPTVELCYLDPETNPNSLTEWELDFCSRPILDIRGKKLWELVVCDESLSLQYTKYFPNNVINSITLKDAIEGISEDLGIPLPDKIRYFRSQMQTIITKACNELGIKPVPSKRCVSLLLWLDERFETIYTRHPGYQKGAKPLLALDNPFPMELPDNLFGDRWAFVQLPLSAVREEISSLESKLVFGSSLDLDLLGIEIDDGTLIPGLAVSSSRAKPLAAWMNGLEVCSVEADVARASLILSVGISTRYVYATYKKSSVTTNEAEAWEAAKKAAGGLHFLAIQEDLDSDDCVGFWLLLDLPPPPV